MTDNHGSCPNSSLSLGELRTLAPLDREEQAVYHLLVKATDGGGRSCQAAVVLTLEDVNDNAPEFTADPYTITVFENTEPGTLLTRVQATDADAGTLRHRVVLLPLGVQKTLPPPPMVHILVHVFDHLLFLVHMTELSIVVVTITETFSMTFKTLTITLGELPATV